MARRFEQRIAKEDGVASVTTWVGSGVPRFYLPLDQQLFNDNFALYPGGSGVVLGCLPKKVDGRS